MQHRVPLCAEDVEATDGSSLFVDEDGYIAGLCGKHSVLVVAEAAEGRACTGAVCAAIHQASGVTVPALSFLGILPFYIVLQYQRVQARAIKKGFLKEK